MKKLISIIILGLAFALGLSAQSPSSVSSEEVATIKTVRETWRIQADISTTDATLEILRRETRSVGAVTIGTQSAPTIRRSLSNSATDTVTLTDETALTFAQVFEAVARLTALWEAQDAPPVVAAATYQLDDNGDQVLDDNGDPIPVDGP